MASRLVVAIAGVVLIVLGFVPEVAEVVVTMPAAILGGAGIVLFGMIFSIGLRIVFRRPDLNRRNLSIVAVSVVFGGDVKVQPNVLQDLLENLRILAGFGLILGRVTALVLNAVLPEEAGRMTGGPVGEELPSESGTAQSEADD